MKILYFISVHGHGSGGHFHSLNHISLKMGEEHQIKIISFGIGKSEIIESNSHFLRHIYFNGLNNNLRKLVKQEINIFKPDIFHFFDVDSYNLIRLIISSNKNKFVLSKCGGPNPKNFPYIKNLILFSLENQEWFSNHNKFKNTNIYLIPNRIKTIKNNSNFQPIEKDFESFTFMRICRIGSTYKKSILDSINLISKLIAGNIKNIKLYVVGVVQDSLVLDELKKHVLVKQGFIILLTEYIYTQEASKMLYLADAVIGTGRGLMEAASLNKPILAIDKNGEMPVLLNERNFNDAFRTNFSERNTFRQINYTDNFNNIEEIIRNKERYLENCVFVRRLFDNYFSLAKVGGAYTNVYKKAKTTKRRLIVDSIIILKSIFSFYRSYLKLRK